MVLRFNKAVFPMHQEVRDYKDTYDYINMNASECCNLRICQLCTSVNLSTTYTFFTITDNQDNVY